MSHRNEDDTETNNDIVFNRKNKSSFRLRLARALSPARSRSFRYSNGGNISSPESSPGYGSTTSKTRYSWQSSLFCKEEKRSDDTLEVFSPPGSPSATVWYADIRMKYSPQQQQQQQKEGKSESEMSSVNATPSRAASALQRSASAASAAAGQSTSAARRSLTCRPLSTDMFAWMRVFRLGTMLHQVGC